jgi:hypothetical protein
VCVDLLHVQRRVPVALGLQVVEVLQRAPQLVAGAHKVVELALVLGGTLLVEGAHLWGGAGRRAT